MEYNEHSRDIIQKYNYVSDLHPNISDFRGLLLQVFLSVPSVVDHQLTCTKCCHKCEK